MRNTIDSNDAMQTIVSGGMRKYLDAKVAPLVEDHEDAHKMPPAEVLQKMGECARR